MPLGLTNWHDLVRFEIARAKKVAVGLIKLKTNFLSKELN